MALINNTGCCVDDRDNDPHGTFSIKFSSLSSRAIASVSLHQVRKANLYELVFVTVYLYKNTSSLTNSYIQFIFHYLLNN